MFEIADRLVAALDAGATLAVATAVSIDGSAPRTIGTSMAFDGAAVIGSIAGGCVEGAVIDVCERVLDDGRARTVEYGVSEESAYDVGLTCGGTLRIHVRLVTAAGDVAGALRAATRGEAAAFVSVLEPDGDRHARQLAAQVDAHLARGASALVTVDCAGEAVEAFIEVAAAPPHLVILGAMEFAAALAAAALVTGYRVTVCDPRALFATPTRFPGVELVVAWPPRYLAATPIDERTVICVLSHDARFDAEAIEIALRSAAGYVGAMGSRRTHDRRVASLRERGLSEQVISGLRSPIGLDLGASSPEETAVSILAEVLMTRTATTAAPLSTTAGPIHHVVALPGRA